VHEIFDERIPIDAYVSLHRVEVHLGETPIRKFASHSFNSRLLALISLTTLALLAFVLLRNDEEQSPNSNEPSTQLDSDLTAPALDEPAPSKSDSPAERELAGAELPPPIDLARCDRDFELFGIVIDAAGAPISAAEPATFSYPPQRTVLLHPMRIPRASMVHARAPRATARFRCGARAGRPST
jgi:hypothetical protein